MQDLRLVEIEKRDAMEFGLKEGIGTIIGAGVLAMIGLYAYSKSANNIQSSWLDGGTYINSSHYCSVGGAWNGTNCNGGTVTAITDPTGLTTLRNVRSNVTSGFDLTSVAFIVIAASIIIGIIYLAFR